MEKSIHGWPDEEVNKQSLKQDYLHACRISCKKMADVKTYHTKESFLGIPGTEYDKVVKVDQKTGARGEGVADTKGEANDNATAELVKEIAQKTVKK